MQKSTQISLTIAGLVFTGAACTASSQDVAVPNQASELVPATFVNVTVVPMAREGALSGQTVVIRDGRIAQIGPADRIEVPPDARRIAGAGKYLMPGLVDAHFHLQNNQDDRRLLQLLVANGVTSILNLYGTPATLDLARRVARREVPGPAIYTSGPYISDAPSWQPEADEVERLVVEQKRAGYDLVKTHGDFSREAFRRLFAVARREGLKVIGHAPRNLGVEPMFEEHMDAVAHGEEFIYAYFFFGAPDLSRADPEMRRQFLARAEERIPELASATAKAGTWVVPNLVAYKMIVEQGKDLAAVLRRPETKYLPPGLAAEWQPGRNRYDRKYSPEIAEHMTWRLDLLSKLTGAFRQAGVRMMAGTDAPIPGVLPGFSLHDELTLLVAAGLTPYQALRAATADPAEFLGRSGEFGTVAVGQRADLLLLDADPLRDVANVTRRAGVMVRGRWLTEDELSVMLAN
jgi:imidazolonepropionase-like amidohydrolase